MVLNGLFRALPGDRAFCHRHWRIKALYAPGRGAQNLRKLDASVGASGPHDFAVRGLRLRHRYRRLSRRSLGEGEKAPFVSAQLTGSREAPPLPSSRAPGTATSIAFPFRVRDDRDYAPLWDGTAVDYKLIWVGRKAKFREIPK